MDKVRYGVDNHRGSVENFRLCPRVYGIARKDSPMSLSLLMNRPIAFEEGWSIQNPVSRPKDRIELRTEWEVLVAIPNFPQGLKPRSAGEPSHLPVTVVREERDCPRGTGKAHDG
jgi:uncharacterized protein YcgI (DUF1989 family)